MFSGIASIVGKVTEFVLDVAAIPLVYIESSKNHDKAKFKMGSTSIEFDDSISVKMQNTIQPKQDDTILLQKYITPEQMENPIIEQTPEYTSYETQESNFEETQYFG